MTLKTVLPRSQDTEGSPLREAFSQGLRVTQGEAGDSASAPPPSFLLLPGCRLLSLPVQEPDLRYQRPRACLQCAGHGSPVITVLSLDLGCDWALPWPGLLVACPWLPGSQVFLELSSGCLLSSFSAGAHGFSEVLRRGSQTARPLPLRRNGA